jgi:hypothetical protein
LGQTPEDWGDFCYNEGVRREPPAGGLFMREGRFMKLCKTCRTVMIGATAPQSFHHIERLLRFHGFVPKTIHDVATSLGPMCEKCLKDWAKELSSN